jgi:hypothetical protein
MRDELSQARWRDRMADKRRDPMRAWIMSNPCFYLFAAPFPLLILLSAFDNSAEEKLWFTAINLPVLVPSVVTLGRSRFLFWVTR